MDLDPDLIWQMGDSMLMDLNTTNAYNRLLNRCKKIFKDKIVMDVGCRSGLLSMMSVDAGAFKVIAVGSHESAMCVKDVLAAKDNGEKLDVFEFVEGDIDAIRLPGGLKKVDIIVSEWLGHSIFVESLFNEVIYARTVYLRKGGLIIPNKVVLMASGMEYCFRPENDAEPVTVVDDYVSGDRICTDQAFIKEVDLNNANIDDDTFRAKFQLKGLKKCRLGAVVLHMEVGFTRPDGRTKAIFSTSPDFPPTYLRQTVLFVDGVVEVDSEEILDGTFGMYRNEREARKVQYSLTFPKYDGESSSDSDSDESMKSEESMKPDTTESSDPDVQIGNGSSDETKESEEDAANGTEIATENGSEYQPKDQAEPQPDFQPEYQPEYHPEYQPEYQTENHPKYQPKYLPEYCPEYLLEYHTEYKSKNESKNMIQDMEQPNTEPKFTSMDNLVPQQMPLEEFKALFKAPGFYVERDPSEFL